MQPTRTDIFDAVVQSVNTHGKGLPEYDKARREGRFPVTASMICESRNMSTPVFHARCLVEHIARDHCRASCVGVSTIPTNDQLSVALYGGMPMRSLQVRRHKTIELLRENIVFQRMYLSALDILVSKGLTLNRYRRSA